MTPQIALDLSLDGITVLSRAPEGGWWREGTVRLDAPDMPARLARLRDKAEARVGADFTSLLILPDSQLLYTSLERDDRRPEETIRALLKGRTPYAVEDLAFDYIQRGDRLQVAVVALETLLEAETFAADYGFRPVGMVANPQDPAYPGIPNFGPTGLASDLLQGAPYAPDVDDGFKVTAAPKAPKPPKIVRPSPEPDPQPEPEVVADTPVAAAPEVPEPAAPEPKIATETPEPTDNEPPASVAADPVASPTVEAEPTPFFASPRRKKADKRKSDAADAPAAPTSPVVEPPAPASPGFSTSRRGKDAAPTAKTASGERLARVAPRLTATPGAPSKARQTPPTPTIAPPPEAAPTTPAPPRPAALGGQTREPVPPRAPLPTPAPTENIIGDDDIPPDPRAAPVPLVESDAPAGPSAKEKAASAVAGAASAAKVAAGGLAAAAARLKAARAQPKAEVDPALEAEAEAARQAEAQALALPGIAREKAATPRKSSAKLGLYMTVGLLAILGAVGLGSVLLGPSDTSDVPLDDAPTVDATPQVASLPRQPDASPTDAPDDAPQDDVAVLLPDPTLPDAGASTPSIVEAPLPITSDAGEQIASAPAPAPLSEDQVLPEIVPDQALAPALDTAPSLDTSTTSFTQPLTAEGLFEAPETIAPPDPQALEGVNFAAVDPALVPGDLAPLPTALPPADSLTAQPNPPPAGTEFETDATTGLITATAEGVVAPGGYTVVLGRPAVLPVPRPGSEAETADVGAPETPETTEETQNAAVAATPDTEDSLSAEEQAAREVLRRTRPVPRPQAAETPVATTDEAVEDDPVRAELSRTRPTPRPASISAAARAAEEASAAEEAAQQAAAASLAAATDAAVAEAQANVEESTGPVSELALAASDRPRSRPRSVEREAARIVTRRREQAAEANTQTASAPAASSVDSGRQTTRSPGGSVARAATQQNVLRLNQINLIGVYGRPNARRALVRLSNGRYVKVEVGDRLDRGRVTAIGESELSYQRGGRNVVLRMPRA